MIHITAARCQRCSLLLICNILRSDPQLLLLLPNTHITAQLFAQGNHCSGGGATAEGLETISTTLLSAEPCSQAA